MFRHSGLPTRTLLAWLMIALWISSSGLFTSSCRSKDTITNPDTGAPQLWHMTLNAPPTMYRDTLSGHVPNDTIGIRVYNQLGVLTAGTGVRVQCDISHDSISSFVTTRSDTIASPWGSNPAIIYWGSGGVDERETVRAFAIVNGDTLAWATTSFKVINPGP